MDEVAAAPWDRQGGEIDTDTRVTLFERMLLMRRFEEEVIAVAAAHKYIGRNHLYIGHEATGAAVLAALRPGDVAHTTHRNHGHLIARGADPGKALAEIMGRENGYNRGRGGTWHICSREVGFLSTSAMVGGSVGLAVGAGLAAQRARRRTISVALFGDGALDEGIGYEGLNFASVFNLPVLFMCENNAKTGQRPSSMLAAQSLLDVPRALRIESVLVNGVDVEAVYKTATWAVERIRRTGAPVFIEAKLERWPGSHQLKPELTTGRTNLRMGFDLSRITGEHADWIGQQDPVLRHLRILAEAKVLTEADALAIDRRVDEQMKKARAYAEASPFPNPESAPMGVFA
ncbi:MAG TPA: thiamine pyrophosphate-dependent dehydrogenase E1 component subunit alpha [Xanthobacteraceae bacterium]|nr:thiamine pyrophosphate-dependent dehydrogenase E1 component subunit alpha [Xanthobacteraceae bacterium]